MFQIDRISNRIIPLQAKGFGELGFTERKNLQEWLAHRPDALGEELLIIQKEFDGFAETRERLDLLALDKNGNLVVIENKLDDSGKDVVWQALKYASYCANLTKLQIVEIFRQYLKEDDNAEDLICEFLEASDIDEVKINIGNSQRLMFVAANFPKEVTNTALWLLGQGISIQCFRAKPYVFGEQLLLSIDQIIPTPEAKEFMIIMKTKEEEEKSTEALRKDRHVIRLEFWKKALESFRISECKLYNNLSPGEDHWLSAGSGVSSCPFVLIFGKKEVRVELSLMRSNAKENDFLFSELKDQQAEIEGSFGKKLIWNHKEGRKASRIQFRKLFDGYNRDNWPEMIQWLVSNMTLFEKALRQPLAEAGSKLKVLGIAESGD
ncbi:MAG: DUF4268 domain-containing protein [Candidatus Dadabacteria bacterium]|nr:DUF4268 domain-containing protein [Candidatus Dadabacteria bacterium]MYE61323.1 DUF4268 domain-containing protein [Candidatus Dadabacteria bacterium]